MRPYFSGPSNVSMLIVSAWLCIICCTVKWMNNICRAKSTETLCIQFCTLKDFFYPNTHFLLPWYAYNNTGRPRFYYSIKKGRTFYDYDISCCSHRCSNEINTMGLYKIQYLLYCKTYFPLMRTEVSRDLYHVQLALLQNP